MCIVFATSARLSALSSPLGSSARRQPRQRATGAERRVKMWRAAKSSGSKSYGGIDDSEAAQPAVAASSASSASASPARSAGAAGRELEHEQQQHVQAASTSGQGTEAYNETPKRAIHDRNQDSVISLFSNESIAGSSVGGEEDNHDDEDEERLSDDLSDDSTALASRPAYLDSTSTASAPSQPAEQRSSLSSSLDDMVTPSLHTAGMASLQFGYPQNAHNNDSDTRTYSRPPHISSRPSSSSHRSSAPQSPGAPQMTLASYLSSNLSSPKTRSHSSSSLASFPTDFLSDISRAESVVDTDDGASDLLNSDGGEEIGTSSVSRMPSVSDMSASARLHPQHLTHSSDLVMPTLAPASTASTAGSSPSDSERATSSAPPVTRGRPTRPKQASSTSNSTLTSSSATFPRVLIAGGTSE